MPLSVIVNGEKRIFAELETDANLEHVLASLQMKLDRVAVERNGEIVRRGVWSETLVEQDDKLEIVHFVGGGLADASPSCRRTE